MSIAVISDLHLGARRATDSFGHEDGEFLKFLGFLERNFERIVLLGDIWETLTSRVPNGHAEELRLARENHREIAERLRRAPYVYVHGNHDRIAAEMDSAPDEYRMLHEGMRLTFAHGHQSDALVMNARPISEIGVWLGGWLRRAGMRAAYELFDQLDQLRSEEHQPDRPTRVERWALAHAARSDSDVVVTGHTHVARAKEHGSRMFLNSGSCSEGRISFLSIEPRRGRYEVHDSY